MLFFNFGTQVFLSLFFPIITLIYFLYSTLPYDKQPVEGCSIAEECSICPFWSSKVWKAASIEDEVLAGSICQFQSFFASPAKSQGCLNLPFLSQHSETKI